MAADKGIMKAIETLRLDRPGRTRHAPATGDDIGKYLIDALRELAATYREEAELWARSGAKGWKGSEAEKYLVAQHIDDVAAQLDNAGGGAALSVTELAGRGLTADDLEAELRESAKRIDAVYDLAGLDALIADSVAQRKGHVRDELLPDGHPARSPLPMAPGTRIEIGGDDVTAYLKGEVNDIPGSAPLAPGSVTSALEVNDPFAPATLDGVLSLVGQLDETLQVAAPYCRKCDLDQHRCPGCGEPVEHDEPSCAQCNLIHADVGMPPRVPGDWSSETMTADGHRLPGLAPLLGQPGDAGAGYSHDYIPVGGRRFTYAELLSPIPAASFPAHLSHSQGNTIGDCATKYRLQRVEQLPQVPQWANVGGSAFHAAVEAIEYMMVNKPGLSLDGYDCEKSWKIYFEGEISLVSASSPVPVSVWRASRKGAEGRQWWEVNGPMMLKRYLNARPAEQTAVFPRVAPDPMIGIELDLTVDVPTGYGPVSFNAKIDRVTIGDTETLIIRDYKTSYERPTDTTQLGDYAHVLLLSGSVDPRMRILGTYFDARRGEWTELVDLLTEHSFEAFQYRVTTAHAQKRALTTGPTPARPSSYCGGCSVRYACPIMGAKP